MFFRIALLLLVLISPFHSFAAVKWNNNTGESQKRYSIPENIDLTPLTQKDVPVGFPNSSFNLSERCKSSNNKSGWTSQINVFYSDGFLWGTRLNLKEVRLYEGYKKSNGSFEINVSSAAKSWSNKPTWIKYKFPKNKSFFKALEVGVKGTYRKGNYTLSCSITIQPAIIEYSTPEKKRQALSNLKSAQERLYAYFAAFGMSKGYAYSFNPEVIKVAKVKGTTDELGDSMICYIAGQKPSAQWTDDKIQNASREAFKRGLSCTNEIQAVGTRLVSSKTKWCRTGEYLGSQNWPWPAMSNLANACSGKDVQEISYPQVVDEYKKFGNIYLCEILNPNSGKKKRIEQLEIYKILADDIGINCKNVQIAKTDSSTENNLAVERRRQVELEKQRKAEEEQRRLAELEKQRKAEEEQRRLAELEKQRKAEEEQRRLAELEKQRKAEEEQRRLAELEKQRKAEEEQRRLAELEKQRKAEEEQRRLAELEKQRKAEEERRQLAEADKSAPYIELKVIQVDGYDAQVGGLILDDTGVVSAQINGAPLTIDANGEFSLSLYVPRTGARVTVQALDKMGKITEKELFIERQERAKLEVAKFDGLNPTKRKAKKNRNAIALIIGISSYQRTEVPAIYADDDAKYFYDYAMLKLGVPEANIREFINEKADQFEILLATKKWLKRQVVEGNSDIYVFFAGHGLASEDGNKMFMLPYDGAPELLDKTAILREELFADIAATKPRSVTVFMDTCYSGTTRGTETLIASRPIAIRAKRQSIPDGFTVLTAAGGEETAKPLEEAKHGMFSYFVMKGMEGDADTNNDNQITAKELHLYVEKNVVKQSGGKQTPEIQGDAGKVLVRFE